MKAAEDLKQTRKNSSWLS